MGDNTGGLQSAKAKVNIKSYTAKALAKSIDLQDISSNYNKEESRFQDEIDYTKLNDKVFSLEDLRKEAQEQLEKERIEKKKKEQEKKKEQTKPKEESKKKKGFWGMFGDYAATITTSFTCGVLDVVENIGDGLIMAGGAVVSGVATITGNEEFAESAKEWTKNVVEYDWTDKIYDEAIGAMGVDKDIAYGAAHTVAQVAGTAAGYIALSVATGGAVGAIGGAAGASAATISTATTVVSTVTGALAAGGSAAQTAFERGADFDQGLKVAAIAGAAGAVTGGLSDKIGVAAKGAKTASEVFKHAGLGALDAMAEPVVNSVGEYAIYGKDMLDENGNKMYDNILEYYLKSGAAVNTLMAGGIGGISTGIKGYKGYKENLRKVELEDANKNLERAASVVGALSAGDPVFGNTVEQNIWEMMKRHDAKYGDGDAWKRLLEFTDPTSSNYRNYNMLSSFEDARDILKLYDSEQIRHAMVNMSYQLGDNNISGFFTMFGNSADGTYGANQGGIKELCVYTYNGKKYSYRDAMDIYNDAVKNNRPLPQFKKEGTLEYFRLRDKLVKQGFSAKDASVIMSTVDDAGACSYASTINEIFASFANKESEFAQKFGYSMYRIENGQKVLNSNELLLDLYVYSNRATNGGGFILQDNTLNPHLLRNDRFDVLGRQMLDANQQVFMSELYSGKNSSVVSNFLNSKGVSYQSQRVAMNLGGTISDNNFQGIINDTINELNSGKALTLDIFASGGTINMKSTNPNLYGSISTKTWTEGGGHSIFITGWAHDGFYVSSWGREYKIPFEDLKNGGVFNIFSATVK